MSIPAPHAPKPLPWTVAAGWRFDNSYARLPEPLFQRIAPTAVRAPSLVLFNHGLARELGLRPDSFTEDCAQLFAGNVPPEGAEPIAQAYAGHQFGHFTMLGDGRAILLGEQITPDGRRFDVQLKGAGATTFSRRGDGRAALGPMLREYIVSEAMHALGIPTTRSLAVVETGEPVFRETPLRGAILTRVARSHIRVGTFEYAAARRDTALLRALAGHTLARHVPDASGDENPFRALLDHAIAEQASLVAGWQLVGFVHGVMNTDNMSLAGETIDYGPCAFMDAYDPATVFSSIDHAGRYAFGRQGRIAHWNLTRFAETLLPLLHDDESEAVALAEESLGRFPVYFDGHVLAGMRRKLGLFSAEPEDAALIDALLQWMLAARADYTSTLRALCELEAPSGGRFEDARFDAWHRGWRERLGRQTDSPEEARGLMRAHNPIVIPRNQYVEEALSAASDRGDLSPVQNLLAALSRPYEETPENAPYRGAPPSPERPYRTFCGT